MGRDLTINGTNASTYGVLFEYPSLENLLAYAASKAAITNSSRHANGISIDARNTKVDSRTLELAVSIKGSSESDFFDKHLAFETLLRAGASNTGITELGLDRFLWRLRFESCEPLTIFANTIGAKYMLTFTEPDPTNRFADEEE